MKNLQPVTQQNASAVGHWVVDNTTISIPSDNTSSRQIAPQLYFSLSNTSFINPDTSVPHKERLGRCYELAGNLALHNPEVVLIHGSIQGMGFPRIGHAWVSLPDGQTWEPTSNRVWTGSVFEKFYRPQVDKKYLNQAMLRQVVRYEHWGPWEIESSGKVHWTAKLKGAYGNVSQRC